MVGLLRDGGHRRPQARHRDAAPSCLRMTKLPGTLSKSSVSMAGTSHGVTTTCARLWRRRPQGALGLPNPATASPVRETGTTRKRSVEGLRIPESMRACRGPAALTVRVNKNEYAQRDVAHSGAGGSG